jgi:hypothetical protein
LVIMHKKFFLIKTVIMIEFVPQVIAFFFTDFLLAFLAILEIAK